MAAIESEKFRRPSINLMYLLNVQRFMDSTTKKAASIDAAFFSSRSHTILHSFYHITAGNIAINAYITIVNGDVDAAILNGTLRPLL